MADTTTEGLKVAISYTLDVSSLNAAKAQLTSFTTGATQTISQATSAMNTAGAAADSLSGKTANLGSQMGATGSRREMSESLRLMQAGATGTGGAFDALRAIMLTFGSSLGGPALIGITAFIAVLGSAIALVSSWREEQDKLNQTAAALNLPVDQVKNMSQAGIDLATSIASANAGLSKLGQAKVNLLSSMGLDPTSTAAAEQALATIANSAEGNQQKLQQIAILYGLTGDNAISEAQSKLNDYLKTSEQSVLSWWQRLGAIMANSEGDISNDDLTTALQTKGQVDKKNNTGKTPANTALTQEQLDAAQTLQDELLAIIQKGSAARVATIKDAGEKIIAEAQQETTSLIQEAAKQAAAQPGGAGSAGGQSILAAANTSAAQIMGDAKVRAAQATHQQLLDEQTKFDDELNRIVTAGNNAEVSDDASASDKIIAQGSAKIATLIQQLQRYYSSPEFQKLSAPDQAAKSTQLNSALSTATTQIATGSSDAAQKAADQQTIANEQKLQSDLTSFDKQGTSDRIALATTEAEQIQLEGQQAIDQLNTQYVSDTTAFAQQLADKKISQEQFNDDMTALNTSYWNTYQLTVAANAKKAETPMQQMFDKWSDDTAAYNQFYASTVNSMAGGLATFVATGKFDFQSFTQSILTDLAKISIEKAIAGIAGSLFGNGGSNDVLMEVQPAGSLMGAGMAGGGTVQAGIPIPINERGDETFIPNVGGTVVNNSASTMGGGSGPITVTINNQGTPQKVQSAQPTQTLEGMVISIITNDIQRGGKTAQTISSGFGVRRQGG